MKNFFLIAGLVVLLAFLYQIFNDTNTQTNVKQLSYSEFSQSIDSGNIQSAIISDNIVEGQLKSGMEFITNTTGDPALADRLSAEGVAVKIQPREGGGLLSYLLTSILPIILLVVLWFYVMRQMQGGGKGGGGALSFGKSRARLLTEHQGRITFDDVAGINEAKEELHEIVDFLKNPNKFQVLGGRIPKGALLVGPPGTGKTLLARAIAGEANVPFFSISGSDFVEMFVGVGASRVRDMFEQAKKNAPCIIFIDEIDAVGRHRGGGMGGGNDEREQTLNQLLVEMDGFESNDGIILIAATNRPDVLDPALLRPGRFDRQVTVPNPDVNGREEILKVHMKKIVMAPNVNVKTIARGTPGFSGADLANLVNESALLAARQDKRMVTSEDFESAKDKVMMGSERRSMAMTEDEKKLTAYHEAGHALVGIFTEGNDPLHKVTIIPRGRALGMTMNLPERDKWSIKKNELEARIAMMFGGRVAEQLIFGEDNVTTGASNDIQQATNMARSMVTQYGMSDLLGRVRYKGNENGGYPGAQDGDYSESTRREIDQEVKRITDNAERHAVKTLTEHIKHLHNVSEALLEYESLSGKEVKKIIDGQPIRVYDADHDKPKSGLPSL
ncbi:MAG: cell division protease FtsH [Alphaproteobacteria bacterium]|jgi:cell division protease FtsH